MKISNQEYQELKSSLDIKNKIISLLFGHIKEKDDILKAQSVALKRAAALIERLSENQTT